MPDYSNIIIPDPKRTIQSFEDWRKSQGFKTEEEKQEELKQKMKAAQERAMELDNGATATDYYYAFQEDPQKRAEWDRQAKATVGHGIGAIATIASAGTMGLVPSILSTAAGYGGGHIGYKLGEAIDEKYGTETAPWLSLALGAGIGIGAYGGLVRAGSKGLLGSAPYTHLVGKQNLAYGSQFTKDVVDDLAKTMLKKYVPTYGKVKYYGPTMGKTTAAKSNPNLVDFDDYVRPDLEQLASELGITRQQLMMSQDPAVREKARQLMLKSVDGWKKNTSNDGKTLVISKSDILQDPIFDNQPLVLQRDEFLKRNTARGETDIQNSLDWYASTRRKGEGKLMEWPDPKGVYISDLEPYVQDPHARFKYDPTYGFKKVKEYVPTSYKFFERPSKLTDAERLGIPKGERINPKSLDDPQYWGYKEWNHKYNSAISSNDLNEASRLRELHFKTKSPNTKIEKKLYHGNRTDSAITKFDKSKIGTEHKDLKLNGFWFVDDPEIAKWEYARKPESFGKGKEGAEFGEVIPVYVNLENPVFAEQGGLRTNYSPYGNFATSDESFLELMNRIRKSKTEDGYVLRLIDSDGNADPFYHSIQNQVVVKKPTLIKRADAITYDDFGNIIPIIKRDNFKINDIRYMSGGKI